MNSFDRILRLSKRAPKLLIFFTLYIFAVVWYVATSLPPRFDTADINIPFKRMETSMNSNQTSCNMKIYINKNYRACMGMINTLSQSKSPDVGYEKVTGDADRYFDNSCGILAVIKSCEEARNSYLYGKQKITDEEKAFPLAFALKIHTSGNQAHRLLRYIYRPHNIYCIHVDKKAPEILYQQFLTISKCFHNIIVIKDRVRVIYSSIRQVQAEMKCMESTLLSGVDWKYYINLAGHEFMLKTNLQIVKILKLLNGSNDIESYPLGDDIDRVLTSSVLTRNLVIKTQHRKEPFNKNITLRKGSAYGLFSRDFVEFFLMDKFVGEFIEWLNDTYAPEETIWATLNTLPWAPGGYQGDIAHRHGTFLSRAVKWKGSNTELCYGKYVRMVCVYGRKDLPWLFAHRNIVANKFYEYFEPEGLDCIESIMYRSLTENTRDELAVFDEEFYKAIIRQRHTLTQSLMTKFWTDPK